MLIQPTIAVIGFIGALTTQGDSPYLTIFTVGCALAAITAISGLFNSDSFLAASLDSWALVLLGFTAAIISIVSSVQHNSTQYLILTVDSLILTLVVLVAAVAASIYLLIRVLIQGMEVEADELAKQEAKGIVDAVESPKLLSGSTTRDSSAPDE